MPPRFLDTNLLLRYLTRDDEEKAERALELLLCKSACFVHTAAEMCEICTDVINFTINDWPHVRALLNAYPYRHPIFLPVALQ